MTPAQAIDRWPALRGYGAFVVAVLATARGRVVETDTLLVRMTDFAGQRIDRHALVQAVRRARRAGVAIRSEYAVGYCLEIEDTLSGPKPGRGSSRANG
jgi:hypothetical protein